MKVALHEGHGKMRIVDVPRPEAGPGEAVARVAGAGICGSDLLLHAADTGPETVPAGHEVAGEIVAVGDGVDPALVGRRVAIDTVGQGRACDRCWYCRIGQYILCQDPATKEGGFAEFIKRRAAGCYPVPDNLSWEEAALVEPLAVSVHGLRRGRMSGGETVLVLGAGAIGLTAIAAARAMGAGQVLVTARHAHQAAIAKLLGADVALPSEEPGLSGAVLEATEGRGADLTIECVGGFTNAPLKQSIELTRPQGRIVVVGGFLAPMTLDWLQPLSKELSVIFSSCYSVLDGRHDYEIAIELMSSGRVELKQLVTHRFPLSDIQQAFDTADDKSTGSIKVHLRE